MKTNRTLAALALAFVVLLTGGSAFAQNNYVTPGGSQVDGKVIMCWNGTNAVPCGNSTTPLNISGSFSATLGGFSPNGTYTSLTATASSSVSTSLSGLGTTVRLTNLGSGTVSCTFSTGSATGVVNNTQIGPSSSVSRVIGTFTSVACIDQTGSSGSQLVILEGGSGLGNDTGGGGGGGSGGGGAVFGPTAVGSAAANPPVLMGGTANGTATGNVAVAEIKTASSAVVGDPAVVVSDPVVASALTTGNGSLAAIATNTGAAIPAGAASIGQVGSDPSSGKGTPTFAFLALPATTTTQIVALSGTKVTYVTSMMAFGGGTVNVTFKYGTGTNCGTGTTTLAGPYPLTAQAGFALGAGTGPVMIVPSGQELCITTDASVSGGVQLTFQQI